MKNLSYLLSLLLLACAGQPEGSSMEVNWVASTAGQPWVVKTTKVSKDASDGTEEPGVIKVYPPKMQQEIDGFGGCFNELGWEALQVLPADRQDSLLNAVFDPMDGCRFTLCRMPLGANDYAVDWYSHNEVAGDFEMRNFSIARDRERLIPYIKKAQQINPAIEVWASPWSPPSWMKINNHYACNPDKVNDLKPEGKGQEMVSQFRMEEAYLTAYAHYFSKFVSAYAEEEIDISAVHVQNEPNSCQNFPSCVWHPDDLATFIGDYLGPKLAADHPQTKLWLGTIERPQIERVSAILEHPEAKKYIKGVGFQWAGKGAIPKVNTAYPDLRLMQTETECGNGSNDWAAAEHTFGLMKHYFNNGANAYLYWNIFLNETGKSQWGWKQNSMISINSADGKVVFNPEFYLMKHFSHFIGAGFVKVESSDASCLAFRKGSELIIVYYNDGDAVAQQFTIGDVKLDVRLAAQSFNTFRVDIGT